MPLFLVEGRREETHLEAPPPATDEVIEMDDIGICGENRKRRTG